MVGLVVGLVLGLFLGRSGGGWSCCRCSSNWVTWRDRLGDCSLQQQGFENVATRVGKMEIQTQYHSWRRGHSKKLVIFC